MSNDVPHYHELFNPTLEALHRLGGSSSINELAEEVVSILNPPQHVVEMSHGDSSSTELEYRLGWARTYLKKVGLVDNSERGVWALTAEGQNTDRVDPDEVVRLVRSQVKAKKQEQVVSVDEYTELEGEAEVPDWKDILLDKLKSMSPEGFERLCQRILRESGFIQVEVTGRSGDGGIDGHGIVQLAGLLSFPVIFQAKRYSGSVGAPDVRNFRGAMVGRADKGLFITTGTFTSSAYAEATRDGAPPIDLVDGARLMEMLKTLKLGVSTKMVEQVEIDTEWFEGI
jgi:restriction system protein